MKTLLPDRHGFTLVELLVVITIIAVLSAIGLTVFNGVQPKARNDRRRADLDSISKALEVNKTSAGYIALADSQFANGKIPTDPIAGYVYCANDTVSTLTVDPAVWTTICPAGYGVVGTTNPPAGTSWKVCASLEAEGGGSPTVYCIKNAQ